MARVFSLDFAVVPYEKATIPVMDRGFLYGDSVYEVVRTYRKRVPFLLDRHYQRLLRSAERIALQIPFTLEKLRSHVVECVGQVDNSDSIVRVIVSRGEDDRFSLIPGAALKPRVVIVVDHIPVIAERCFSEGIKISLVSVRRNLRSAVDPNIKSGNYLNNLLAMMEAEKKGSADAVMLNFQDFVTEGTTSNVFTVKGGTVMTPEVESGLLEGISRALLKELIHREGIPFQERSISKDEFLASDEVFLTGTTKEVMPVTRIDERTVADGKPGPVTRRLLKLFRDEVSKIVG